MRVRLVRIGKSRAFRLPKRIVERCGFGDTVNVRFRPERLIIAPVPRAREGWEQVLREAGPSDKDELLLEGIGGNQLDREEWE